MITTHKLFLQTPKGEVTIIVDSKQIKIGNAHSHVWLTESQSKKWKKHYPKDYPSPHKLRTIDKKYTLFTK